MSRIVTIILAAALLTLPVGCTFFGPKQDHPKGSPHQLTPIHPILQELVGEWDVTMRVWMTPDAEPIEVQSVAYRERFYGDFFVTEESTYDIPGMGKRHFLFYWGISGMTGKFQKLAMGEGNTELSHLTGDWDPAARTITLTPTGGGAMRTVVTLGSPENRREVHETFVPDGNGGEFLQWQFTYTPRRIASYDAGKAAAHGTPGEHHRRLAQMLGRWKATMTLHFEGQPEPMIIRGTSMCVWLVEGLVIQETVRWGDPNAGGFEMHYLHAFHNGTGQYQVVLTASTGSSIEMLSGTPDPKTGTVTVEGRTWDPHLGEAIPTRAEIAPHTETSRTGKLWLRYGGVWKRAGDLEYTRE